MNTSYADFQDALSVFDGFPYLSIRVVPALYHIILLPAGAQEASLAEMARWQAEANRLPVCLVLARDRALYCGPEGGSVVSREPPLGGGLIEGKLAPAVDCADSSDEFQARQKRLADAIVESRRSGRYILGNLTKGGRAATEEQKHRLDGALSDGTPRGLSRCASCGDWNGVCLDPSEQFAGQVMTVHCHCDNHNRCAGCSERLYERRLNANFYDPRDRRIWHVPGFCGLKHHCSSGTAFVGAPHDGDLEANESV